MNILFNRFSVQKYSIFVTINAVTTIVMFVFPFFGLLTF